MTGPELISDLATLFAPPSPISVSAWAEEERYLSPEMAAEPGKWRSFPFQREPMDSVSDPSIRCTVIKSATQLLKSSVIENAVGHAMDTDPGPILLLMPREDDAEYCSRERIGPMIRDTPALARKVKLPRSGRAPKAFRGGRLTIISAGAPGNVAARAIRYLFCDEVDKFPFSVKDEGNPISLARKRMATFRHRAKEVIASSPTIEGSQIDREYEGSDKREFYVPCPNCGKEQSLMKKWHQVKWDEALASKEDQARSARYYCEYCDQPWDDAMRWSAVNQGRWIANAPFNGIAGFWISELYSPFKRLWQIVLDWLTKQGVVEEKKTFINTSLAEPWVSQGEAPEYERLLAQAEDYPVGMAPNGALLLTAGADVQADRIEVEVVGWGPRFESWSVDYQILEGDTSELIGRSHSESGERILSAWEKLSELMTQVYPHQRGGDLEISLLMVDSGYQTQAVYQWTRQQNPARVMAIKGEQKGRLPVSQPSAVDVSFHGRVIKSGLKLRQVNTSYFKGELYAALKKRSPTQEELAGGMLFPMGYCHFPKNAKNYGDEHFKQICAEQLATYRDRRGYQRQEWQKMRNRNEALDVRVYAYAAAWQLGIGLANEQHWDELRRQLGPQQQAFQLQSQESPVIERPGRLREEEQSETSRAPVRDAWVPRRNWFGGQNGAYA